MTGKSLKHIGKQSTAIKELHSWLTGQFDKFVFQFVILTYRKNEKVAISTMKNLFAIHVASPQTPLVY